MSEDKNPIIIGTKITFDVSKLSDSTKKIMNGVVIQVFKTVTYVTNYLYGVYSESNYYIMNSVQFESISSYSDFSAITLANRWANYTPVPKGFGNDASGKFTFDQIRKEFGYKKSQLPNVSILISTSATMKGTMIAKKSYIEKDTNFVRFTLENQGTKFTPMVNDTIPKKKLGYTIMVGRLDPKKFSDPRPQPWNYYCEGMSGEWKEMKFYINKSYKFQGPSKVNDLTIFTDPLGNKYETDINKKTVVPIQKDQFFKDLEGGEWIVDTNTKDNIERCVDEAPTQSDFSKIDVVDLSEIQTHHIDYFPGYNTLGQDILSVKRTIGDVFACPYSKIGKLVVGVYALGNIIDTVNLNVLYMVAPIISVDDMTGIVKLKKTNFGLVNSGVYKGSVLDYVSKSQTWLKEGKEIRFETPTQKKLTKLLFENDPSYVELERKRLYCIRHHKDLNGWCCGRKSIGSDGETRLCMTPVFMNGCFCEECDKVPQNWTIVRNKFKLGQGPDPDRKLPLCYHKGCPGKKQMTTQERKEKLVVYKLSKSNWTTTNKFMYKHRENMDVKQVHYHWERV